MALALALLLPVALHNTLALWLVGTTVARFVICSFVLPVWARHRG